MKGSWWSARGIWCVAVVLLVGTGCSSSKEDGAEADAGSGGGLDGAASSPDAALPTSDAGSEGTSDSDVTDGETPAVPTGCDPRSAYGCGAEQTCQCDFDECWCQDTGEVATCDPGDLEACGGVGDCLCYSGEGCRCEIPVEQICIPGWLGRDSCGRDQTCECDGGTCLCVDNVSCNPDVAESCPLDQACQCQPDRPCFCEPWTCSEDGQPNNDLCPEDLECVCEDRACSCAEPCPSDDYADCPTGLVCLPLKRGGDRYCLPDVAR